MTPEQADAVLAAAFDAACAYAPPEAKRTRWLKFTRRYWYGRSRCDGWPLWISWLLAPSARSREIVRTLRRMDRA